MIALEQTAETVHAETEDALAGRLSFSAHVPNLQTAWDSTSLGIFKSCPRKYYYEIVRGYQTPFTGADLTFGIMFHKAAEIYDKARVAGSEHESALVAAIRYAVFATWDVERQRPWVSEEPTKTRDTLLRTLVWYLDNFKDDRLETVAFPNGTPAIEVSFRLHLGELDLRAPTGEEFVLCGHLDKIVIWNDETFIVDRKTTKYELDDNYFKQFSPDNQMTLYSIAGQNVLASEVSGLIIDGCQILVTGSRFRRKPVYRAKEHLEEWLVDLKFWLNNAVEYATKNHWPMNEKSCGFGRRQCQFRPVCSADPNARGEMLESFYTRRIWDPLLPR